MINIPKPLQGAWDKLLTFFAAIKFDWLFALFNSGKYYRLTEDDQMTIRKMLKDNYFIILTRRKSHLTTYLIALVSAIVTGKFAHYTHALMNVEGDLETLDGYKLIEATSTGVHWSTFEEVFDCDSVVLLSPRGLSLHGWTVVLDTVKSQLGKEYDDLFDIASDQNVSCVEMVYWGLKSLPDYETRFPELVQLIRTRGNDLTPQMLYDCGDLDVAFEIRR
jgi:hypothetical protein